MLVETSTHQRDGIGWQYANNRRRAPVCIGVPPDQLGDIEVDLGQRQGRLPLVQADHPLIARQQAPLLLNLAMRAADEWAVSYRGFKVGAAAYATSQDGLRIGYLLGANDTPFKAAPKRCAEMHVLGKAEARSLGRIVALAVFGPTEFEGVNNLATPTLHPCDPCRELLKTSDVVGPETLIITGNAAGVVEMMTQKELLQLHSTVEG